MGFTFEKKPLEWNETGIEPTSELKAQGFPVGYKPAAEYFNYKFNSDYEAIKELQEKLVEGTSVKTTSTVLYDGVLQSKTEANLVDNLENYDFVQIDEYFSYGVNTLSSYVLLSVKSLKKIIDVNGFAYVWGWNGVDASANDSYSYKLTPTTISHYQPRTRTVLTGITLSI